MNTSKRQRKLRIPRALGLVLALIATLFSASLATNVTPASAGGNGGACYEYRWKTVYKEAKQLLGWYVDLPNTWHQGDPNTWYDLPDAKQPPRSDQVAPTGTVPLSVYGGPSGVSVQYRYRTSYTEWFPSEDGFHPGPPPAGKDWGNPVAKQQVPCTEPDPKDPTYTEWVDGTFTCGDETVTQTRTRTDYTWRLDGYKWVLDETTTEETQTRPLSESEIESCKPDDREPTYTEWTDGTWECGDTEVTQTRVRTDYTWVNTGGSTWELQSTETTESQTRPLTQEELDSCVPPTLTPPTAECVDGLVVINLPPDTAEVTYAIISGVQGDGVGWISALVVAFSLPDIVELQGWSLGSPEFPRPDCSPPETTTTTVSPPSSTTTTTIVPPQSTTTTSTATTIPVEVNISALVPVCVGDAPFVSVTFGNQPELNGRTATVTFVASNGQVVATHTAVYQAGATVQFVYPGASVDADGNPTDWPGWRFEESTQLWVPDDSDAFLRDGLMVTIEVNPTATGSVSYPPADSACANPENPPAECTPVFDTDGNGVVNEDDDCGELPATR